MLSQLNVFLKLKYPSQYVTLSVGTLSDDVIIGFDLLSSEAPPKFKQILNWLENNYIGKLEPNSRTSRVEPRYPIRMWNLHERVKKGN